MSRNLGDVSAREAPGSGERRADRQSATRAVTVRGSLATVQAELEALPEIGKAYSGHGCSGTLRSWSLRPEKGGLATLSITVSDAGTGGADTDDGDSGTWEVEMAQLEKPLLAHPDFSGYAADIEAWRGESDAGLRSNLRYHDASGAEVALSGRAADAARKIMAGVEAYLLFTPVVRRTRALDGPPSGGVGRDCGKRKAPPSKGLSLVAGTWEWLKTRDSVQESSAGCERVEEWTGADSWDADLYAEG